jgi:hypothetical protein
MCSVGWVMTASVKSSLMCPLRAMRPIRAGTVHRPARWLCPLVTWILMSSLAGAGATPPPRTAAVVSLAARYFSD